MSASSGVHEDGEWDHLFPRWRRLLTKLQNRFDAFQSLEGNARATLGKLLSEDEELADEIADFCALIRPGIYGHRLRLGGSIECRIPILGECRLTGITYDISAQIPEKFVWVNGMNGTQVMRSTMSAFLEAHMVLLPFEDDVMTWLNASRIAGGSPYSINALL